MDAPARSPSPNPPIRPEDHPLREKMLEEALKRTGLTPYDWQLLDALNRLAYRDTLTLAGTGAGKTLIFALIAFILRKSITWILAPLNYIQEQQVKNFEGWGVPAVCVNERTNWKEVQKDILRGQYQIVISSPEAFLDVDKLRNVVCAPELSEYRHFVAVDEAHCIHTWTRNDFRKAYGHIGNLRAMLYNVPFTAVTATATKTIRAEIISSLHLGSQLPLKETNLGNFKENIEHSSIGQTLIFVDTVNETTLVADALRQRLDWTGDLADRIRPYHSNRAEDAKDCAAEAFRRGECRILVATEALAMGADFRDIDLVVIFGASDTIVRYLQQGGRSGRSRDTRARSVMMVTPSQVTLAMKLCTGKNGDIKPDDFVDPKVEGEDDEGDALGEVDVVDGVTDAVPEDQPTNTRKGTLPKAAAGKGRRMMDYDVARFITAEYCYTKILDEIFDNPPHISCYEAGACLLCVKRRARDEAANSPDPRAMERAVKREEIEVALDTEDVAEDLPRKTKTPPVNRTGEELRRYKDCVRAWRRKKFRQECKTRFLALEDIATDKALDAIARSRRVVDLASLDALQPLWPHRGQWGEELLVEVNQLAAIIEQEKHEKAEKKKRERQEQAAAKEQARIAEREQREAANRVANRLKEVETRVLRQQQEAASRLTFNLPQVAGTPIAPPTPIPASLSLAHHHGAAQRPLTPTTPTFNRTGHDPPSVVRSSTGRLVLGPDGRTRVIPLSFPMTPYSNQPHTPVLQQPPGYPTPGYYQTAAQSPVATTPPVALAAPPPGYYPFTPQSLGPPRTHMPFTPVGLGAYSSHYQPSYNHSPTHHRQAYVPIPMQQQPSLSHPSNPAPIPSGRPPFPHGSGVSERSDASGSGGG